MKGVYKEVDKHLTKPMKTGIFLREPLLTFESNNTCS
jgi:hypothetical protein